MQVDFEEKRVFFAREMSNNNRGILIRVFTMNPEHFSLNLELCIGSCSTCFKVASGWNT